MQAVGMVNDHLVECHCHATCGQSKKPARRRSPSRQF
jgi:DNA-3-methyladenine glycosylase I